MLTKKDFQKLEEKFASKDELKNEIGKLKKELKHDIVQFKDDILSEIIKLRDDISIVIGYRDIIEDHEVRITKLEHKPQN